MLGRLGAEGRGAPGLKPGLKLGLTAPGIVPGLIIDGTAFGASPNPAGIGCLGPERIWPGFGAGTGRA
jgi:hypothetical protein